MAFKMDKPVLSPCAKEVADIIRQYSTLAEAILNAQCKITGCSIAGLTPGDLKDLIPRLKDAVQRFTSPQKADQLEADLRAFKRKASSGASTRNSSPGSFLGTWQQSIKPKPNTLSYKVLMVLGEHTPFGGEIFNAQCKSIGAEPRNIRPRDLDRLIPKLSERVGQWTSPIKGKKVEAELRRIQVAITGASSPSPTAIP